ncbi:MAG: hypothetical protein AD742_08900 [Methylibium sp. NZG]|nr:MAG: hypothetical protein AD742_08900 [Methylibium sp. NZG]
MSKQRIAPFAITVAAAVVAAAAAAALLSAAPVHAQDYGAMVQQSMARMNNIVAQAEQQSRNIVHQRMQDPQVQAAYRQYLGRMQASGRQAMDFRTYTYQWVYTRGFSADGMRHAQANEAGMRAREHAAWQGLQQAQAARGQAQQAQRNGYFANQQEAGRGLMGQSTYTVASGGQSGVAQMQLPHTWQANTMHQYQGHTYGVDASGQYHVLGSNGWWYPLQRR